MIQGTIILETMDKEKRLLSYHGIQVSGEGADQGPRSWQTERRSRTGLGIRANRLMAL